MPNATFREFVTVIVDGYQLSGWEQVELRRTMHDAAISFTLVATWPDFSPQQQALRNGEQIEIRTQQIAEDGTLVPGSGDLMCAGAVDDYEADIGEGGHKTVTLHGRSNARDVIDCPPVDHKTLRSEKKTLLGVARDLGDEFGVGFDADVDLAVLPKVQAKPGEKLFDTLERHARMEGVLLTGQPDGSIKITRAGTRRHAGTLIEGRRPVTRWSIKVSPGSQRCPVVVRGQRALGSGQDNLRQEDRYQPPGCGTGGRHRPHLQLMEGERPTDKLKTRGAWHHLRSFGYGMTVAPRVSTWRDAKGVLWEPGWLMAIKVPAENIDMDMVLAEATFKQGFGKDGGTRAELVFTDPRALGGGTPGGKGSEDKAFNPGEGLSSIGAGVD